MKRNICITGVPEGKEIEQGIENVFEEIMTEKFPDLAKEIDIQARESQTKGTQRSPHPDTS